LTETAATRTSRTTISIWPKLNHFIDKYIYIYIYIYIRLIIQRVEVTFATKKEKEKEKKPFH
jgi:hypothetical protein